MFQVNVPNWPYQEHRMFKKKKKLLWMSALSIPWKIICRVGPGPGVRKIFPSQHSVVNENFLCHTSPSRHGKTRHIPAVQCARPT
jgi:hypothetical protein